MDISRHGRSREDTPAEPLLDAILSTELTWTRPLSPDEHLPPVFQLILTDGAAEALLQERYTAPLRAINRKLPRLQRFFRDEQTGRAAADCACTAALVLNRFLPHDVASRIVWLAVWRDFLNGSWREPIRAHAGKKRDGASVAAAEFFNS